MDYQTLIGTKTQQGSILSFVIYKKVPVTVVLEDAQALIYSLLRVREMRASAPLLLPAGAFNVALPARFLEPIALRDREGMSLIPNTGDREPFVTEAVLIESRSFDTDAITTLAAGITSGATSFDVADGSVLPDTPFPLTVDDEQMLVTAVSSDTLTVTRGFNGTTAAAHSSGAVADAQIMAGVPCKVSIFNERYEFDARAEEARTYDHVFFRRPLPLSASNPTNFMTERYPHMVRVACLAGAADFMKDKEEYDKQYSRLVDLITAANAEADKARAT